MLLYRRPIFAAAGRGRLLSPFPLLGDSLGGLKYDPYDHRKAVSACLDDESFEKETEADRLVLQPEDVHLGGGQMSCRLRARRQ